MSDDIAITEIVVTNDQFMILNVKMRESVLRKRKDEWFRYAHDFAKLCKDILYNELTAYQIIPTPKSNLELGWCGLSEKDELLREYVNQGGQKGWKNWTYPRLRSNLACEECVRAWHVNYEQLGPDSIWDNENTRKRWGFIAGMGSTDLFDNGSCNITFRKNAWTIGTAFACHSKGTANGFRCNGNLRKLHPFSKGLRLRIMSDGQFHWTEINLYKFLNILGDYKDYDKLQNGIYKFSDYENKPDVDFHEKTETYNDLFGYTHSDSHKLSDKDAFLLEAINRHTWDGKTIIDFKVHEITNRHTMLSFKSSIDRDVPLGIYIYTRQKNLGKRDPHTFFKETKLGDSLCRELNQGTRGSEGGLYRIDPSIFLGTDDEGKGVTSIDFNQRDDLPFISELKQRNTNIVLPKIKTSMRYIKLYHFYNEVLHPLRENQNFTPNTNEQTINFLCIFGGFKPSVNITLTIYERVIKNGKNSKRPVYQDKQSTEDARFFSCEVPNIFTRNKLYFFEISIDDETVGQVLTKNFVIANKHRPQNNASFNNTKLDFGIGTNKRILIANMKANLERFCHLNQDNIDSIFNQGQIKYSEIIKHELSSNKAQFSIPSSRINDRYPGLTEFSFPNRTDDIAKDSPLSGKLRSMGIVTSTRDANNDDWKQDSRLWECYDPHIVTLDDNYSLLLTPNPLSSHISKVYQNLIWTNHGTIIKGAIPSELSKHVKIVDKPYFLNHIAESPTKHIEGINYIMDILGKAELGNIRKRLLGKFKVTNFLHPQHKQETGIYDCNLRRNVSRFRNRWQRTRTEDINSLPLSPFALKIETGGQLTAIDLLYVESKNGDEDLIVIRRMHKSGDCDYLPISRFVMNTNGDFWPTQLEWVGNIERSSISELSEFYDITGAKYQSKNNSRAHDWSYIFVETLRAISSINGFKATDSNDVAMYRSENSQSWPEPLRKFCIGGGYYVRHLKSNSDPMDGILNNAELDKDPQLRKALLGAISRWTWFD